MILTDLLALSHVPRWSNVRHSPPQSVADHSFRVAVIYLELCARIGGKRPSLEALTRAIQHDAAEAYTGDIPGDFKREVKEELRAAEAKLGLALGEEPLEREIYLIKLADKIEGYTFICLNGIGPHADRIKKIMKDELIELAGVDWPIVRIISQDIIEESERN